MSQDYSSHHSESDDEINLAQLWRVLLRQKTTVILTSFSIFLLVGCIAFLSTPIYKATTTIQIQPKTPKLVENLLEDSSIKNINIRKENNFYQTQYEILKSRSIANRVIQHLKISHLLANSPEEAINAFIKKLTINPIKNSQIVHIHFEHFDPDLAAKVTNTLAETLIKSEQDWSNTKNEQTKYFIEEELKNIGKNLDKAQSKLSNFAQENDFIRFNPEQQHERLENLVEELENQYSWATRERSTWKAKLEYLGDTEGHIKVQTDNTIQARRETLATLERSSINNDVENNKKREELIEKIKKNIQLDTEYILEITKKEYQAKYNIALEEEKSIALELKKQKAKLYKLQKIIIKYDEINRNFQFHKAMYDGFLKKTRELDILSNDKSNNLIIIDTATPPKKPLKPNRKIYLLLGLILGLFTGITLAFIRDLLEGFCYETEDLEKDANLSIVSSIPNKNKQPQQYTEAYRSLRTQLRLSESGTNKIKSLCVTSIQDHLTAEICKNLAEIYAQANMRVLLIDADLRTPELHKLLESTNNKQGFSEFVQNEASLNDYFQKTLSPNITLVSAGKNTTQAIEHFSRNNIERIFTETKSYDIVIINTTPLPEITDALLLAQQADATLVIAAKGKSKKQDLTMAVNQLQQAKANIVGGVLVS